VLMSVKMGRFSVQNRDVVDLEAGFIVL
jgi:hypothetical protein